MAQNGENFDDGKSLLGDYISAEELLKNGEKFDVVLALEVIEHVADVEEFIKSCATLVKPNGLVFIATINRTIKSLALAKIAVEYVLRWLPRGTHDWKKFLKPSEIDFYAKNKKYLFSKVIKKNNIIILNQGGHGFKVIQPIEMIEVKQGPYNLRLDKKVFDAIEEKKIRLK